MYMPYAQPLFAYMYNIIINRCAVGRRARADEICSCEKNITKSVGRVSTR